MFCIKYFFSAKFRLLLGFDFTVACVILGPMEWVNEGLIDSLGLDGRIDWSVDRGTED